MKKLFTALLIIIYLNVNAQYKKAPEGKTNYKKGFTYHNNRGEKCTLIAFINGRWKTKFQIYGVYAIGWTDDCWIDIATGKAFLNEQTHQIVYYDEVEIINKNNLKTQ